MAPADSAEPKPYSQGGPVGSGHAYVFPRTSNSSCSCPSGFNQVQSFALLSNETYGDIATFRLCEKPHTDGWSQRAYSISAVAAHCVPKLATDFATNLASIPLPIPEGIDNASFIPFMAITPAFPILSYPNRT